MDVFFYEAFEEEANLLRQQCPAGWSIGLAPESLQETGHAAPPAPILSIRTQSRIPLEWAGRFSAVLTRSTGYDHIVSFRNAVKVELSAGYLPHYCSRAVAEQAMLLWTALLRKLPRQVDQFRRFNRDGLTGRECRNRVLLVVGVGKIGVETARIGQGLEMRVLGVDLEKRHRDIMYVPLAEAIPQADVIVTAMNLTRDNIGYFNSSIFQRCKNQPVFVNVARGELSPATEVWAALEAGYLAGAALDVYSDESGLAVSLRAGEAPQGAEAEALTKLARHPSVILTPHNAFNTEEAAARKVAQSYQQLLHYREYGTFLWNVGTNY